MIWSPERLPFLCLDVADEGRLPCAGGGVLRWSPDGLHFTDHLGDTRLLEPAEVTIKLWRSYQRAPPTLVERLRHQPGKLIATLSVELRSRELPEPVVFSALAPDGAHEGLPWLQSRGEQVALETASSLVQNLVNTGALVARWDPLNLGEPPRHVVGDWRFGGSRRLLLAGWIGLYIALFAGLAWASDAVDGQDLEALGVVAMPLIVAGLVAASQQTVRLSPGLGTIAIGRRGLPRMLDPDAKLALRRGHGWAIWVLEPRREPQRLQSFGHIDDAQRFATAVGARLGLPLELPTAAPIAEVSDTPKLSASHGLEPRRWAPWIAAGFLCTVGALSLNPLINPWVGLAVSVVLTIPLYRLGGNQTASIALAPPANWDRYRGALRWLSLATPWIFAVPAIAEYIGHYMHTGANGGEEPAIASFLLGVFCTVVYGWRYALAKIIERRIAGFLSVWVELVVVAPILGAVFVLPLVAAGGIFSLSFDYDSFALRALGQVTSVVAVAGAAYLVHFALRAEVKDT